MWSPELCPLSIKARDSSSRMMKLALLDVGIPLAKRSTFIKYWKPFESEIVRKNQVTCSLPRFHRLSYMLSILNLVGKLASNIFLIGRCKFVPSQSYSLSFFEWFYCGERAGNLYKNQKLLTLSNFFDILRFSLLKIWNHFLEILEMKMSSI